MRPDADLAAAATLVASSLLFRLVGEQQIPDEALVESVVDLIGRAVGVPS